MIDKPDCAPSTRFDDSVAYERFMGPWSRAAGEKFLEWLAPATSVRWLDVGCGTGILTRLVAERCLPTEVLGIDPVKAQIEHANRKTTNCVTFQAGDAMSLPFRSGSFDVVVSALVLNFIQDLSVALAEMRRVVRFDGLVAAYVWDFENELSPSGPMRQGIRRLGLNLARMPGADRSSLAALRQAFELAGYTQITTAAFDINVTFANFEEFWRSQTTSHGPTAEIIAGLRPPDREHLARLVCRSLSIADDGGVQYRARANSIAARATA